MTEMTAHNHHFLSQCYLKGFTDGGSKKSKLLVLDCETGKTFSTTPRNVGSLRDFNRLDLPGVDQNALEEALAEFESSAASSLRRLGDGAFFTDEIRANVIFLMALLATRSPARRERVRQFHEHIAVHMMDLITSSQERWDGQIRQLKASGYAVPENVTYEDARRFHHDKAYNFDVAREHQIHLEFVGVDAILPTLSARNWVLIRATDETGPFITSDNPVSLTWTHPNEIPVLHRQHPGHGLKGTLITFPISSELAITGEFDGPDDGEPGMGTPEVVANINSSTILASKRQIFARKLGFKYISGDGAVQDGKVLLQTLGRSK